MVTLFYLWRRNKLIWFVLIPMVIMLIMPAWAMLWQMFSENGWYNNWSAKRHLFLFGLVVLALQGWMMVEALLMWPKAKGVLEEKLPPLEKNSKLAASGGRSC